MNARSRLTSPRAMSPLIYGVAVGTIVVALLDATDGVTLGGASIGANAAWSPGLADLHATHAEKIALPAASAALIGLRVS